MVEDGVVKSEVLIAGESACTLWVVALSSGSEVAEHAPSPSRSKAAAVERTVIGAGHTVIDMETIFAAPVPL